MKTLRKKNGMVAILDALGAATYDDRDIKAFLQSRGEVIDLLNAKSEDVSETLDVSRVKTYTFNDTLLLVLEFNNNESCKSEVRAFATVLRKVLVDALGRQIMFRGSIALGDFYEDSETNTILGKAVSDAAAWYDKADWIGILCTPRTTIHIDQLMELDSKNWGHLLIRYDVPLSDGRNESLWTINWPKVFWVPSLSPDKTTRSKRAAFLRILGRFSVPRGTEGKHFNAIKYFDHVRKTLKLK